MGAPRHASGRPRVTALRRLLVGAAMLAAGAAGLTAVQSPSARAALDSTPPANPAANIPPDPNFASSCQPAPLVDNSAGCIDAIVAAIDNARSMEGVGPMSLPTAFASMPAEEQLLVVVDAERVARGLAPFAGTTAELDMQAQDGVAGGQDPPVSKPTFAGSGWTGSSDYGQDYVNALSVDYSWMYDDGYPSDGSTPANTSCTSATARGCWGHRDSLLGAFSALPDLTMGATGQGSIWVVVLYGTTDPPPSYVYTWSTISSQPFTTAPAPGPTPTTTTAPNPTTTVAPARPVTTCPAYVGADTAGVVARLAGPDRDATAIAVSQAGYPTAGSASTVTLASDANYPDALVGGPLAVAENGPLLVTPPGGLKADVEAEIKRVLPVGDTVNVLGGTLALSAAVSNRLTADGYKVRRIQGPDRYATAVKVATVLGSPSTIFEATGHGYADALVAGPAAVEFHGAILLTNGDVQATATAAYLAAHPGPDVAVGGDAAAADPSAASIVGADRYQTAVMLTHDFFSSPTSMGFATGDAFTDALAGSPAEARAGTGLLLVPSCGALPAEVASYLSGDGKSITAGTLYGGDYAVSPGVLTQINGAFG